MPLPTYAVDPAGKYTPALADPDEMTDKHGQPVRLLHSATFEEAFLRDWPGDAHAYCYGVAGNAEIPRLAKPILAALQARGADVLLHTIMVDYDNAATTGPDGQRGHAAWTTDAWEAFKTALGAAAERAPWIRDSLTGCYPTRGGARLVYVLDAPLRVDRGEAVHRGVVELLAQAGLPVARDGSAGIDKGCSDWTRCFRLPRVTRDGLSAPPFEEYWALDARLSPASILGPGATLTPGPASTVRPVEGGPPIDVAGLVGRDGHRPPWYDTASKALKRKACWSAIFDYQPIRFERSNTIVSYAGEVCALLASWHVRGPWTDVGPQHAYALLHAAVEQVEPDASGPAWLDVLWGAITRYWPGHVEAARAKAVETARVEVRADAIEEAVVRVAREWAPCVHPLRGDDAATLEWVRRHAICATPAGYYVLGPHGWYDSLCITKVVNLPPRIRALGMDRLIPLTTVDSKGQAKRRTPQDIIQDHATIVQAVEGVAAGPGNYIRFPDEAHATLVVKLYSRRTDIDPRFDKDVDEWLRAVGGKDYSLLCLALGYFLAFDEGPTSALVLTGPPGFGKKVLANGLGETITSLRTVDIKEAGGFSSALLASPYMIVNEGFPAIRDWTPADAFRRLTGGDVVRAEKKYQDVMDLRVPVRVLMTANNMDVVRAIVGDNADLTLDDRAAIAQRTVHIRVGASATAYLRQKGGLAYTRGWVQADAGGGSDYRVAQHLLWLHKQRPEVPRGNRFLLEGNLDTSMVQRFASRAGVAPLVVEALVQMATSSLEGGRVEGVYMERQAIDGYEYEGLVDVLPPCPRVWVTEAGVLTWVRARGATFKGRELDAYSVGRAMRSLIAEDMPETGAKLTLGGSTAKWYCLDLGALVAEAVEHGWRADTLIRARGQ